VAGHADVVGGRAPRQRDARLCRTAGGQPGRRGRRLRVGTRGRRGGVRALRGAVAGWVVGVDGERVARAAGEAGEGEAGRGGAADAGAVLVGAVAGDDHVVGRGGPGDRDARGRGTGLGDAGGRGGGRLVGVGPGRRVDGGVHVRLQLGRADCAVVDGTSSIRPLKNSP